VTLLDVKWCSVGLTRSLVRADSHWPAERDSSEASPAFVQVVKARGAGLATWRASPADLASLSRPLGEGPSYPYGRR